MTVSYDHGSGMSGVTKSSDLFKIQVLDCSAYTFPNIGAASSVTQINWANQADVDNVDVSAT